MKLNNGILKKIRRIIGFLFWPITKYVIYTTVWGGVRIKTQGGLGFLRFNRFQRPMRPEERLLAGLDWTDKTIYDIGANIGILTVFFAKLSGPNGNVVAFEPNLHCVEEIKRHVILNRLNNVIIIAMGVGSKTEERTLAIPRRTCGHASMDPKIQARIQQEKPIDRVKVNVDTIGNIIKTYDLPTPDFIKIDTEGMENDVLLGMEQVLRKHKPLLHIENHEGSEESFDNIRAIVKKLISYGYSIYHVESEQPIDGETYQAARRGHIFCRAGDKL